MIRDGRVVVGHREEWSGIERDEKSIEAEGGGERFRRSAT